MYEAFFNLKNKPFSLLPDPEFLFLSSRHAIALSLLEYSLSGQAGFCVITGEIGSGKTTLVRAFLGRVGREFTVGLISNTHKALRDVAAWALGAFGQKPSGGNPAETYQELIAFLIAEYGAGRQCILIVDESQNLTVEALEELRLLSNINSGKDLLLQIVLVGQPELLDKLKSPELSQFAQRIAVSHHLTPLPYAETKRYIEHRLKIAGAERPIFTEMAVGAIHYFSGGVPRLINSISDMSLVYAFADAETTISEELVFRVISDRQGSGIAPFARNESASDPAVRAQILNLSQPGSTPVEKTPETAAKGEPVSSVGTEAASAAPSAPADPAADVSQPAPDVMVPAAVESTVGSSQTAPIVMAPAAVEKATEAPKPAAARPAKSKEPRKSAVVANRPNGKDAQEDSGANPYFFRESTGEEELLLTTEIPVPAGNGRLPELHAGPPPIVSSSVIHPLRPDSSEGGATAKVKSDTNSSSLAGQPQSGLDTGVSTGRQNDTAAPVRRSWWRRRLARGN